MANEDYRGMSVLIDEAAIIASKISAARRTANRLSIELEHLGAFLEDVEGRQRAVCDELSSTDEAQGETASEILARTSKCSATIGATLIKQVRAALGFDENDHDVSADLIRRAIDDLPVTCGHMILLYLIDRGKMPRRRSYKKCADIIGISVHKARLDYKRGLDEMAMFIRYSIDDDMQRLVNDKQRGKAND